MSRSRPTVLVCWLCVFLVPFAAVAQEPASDDHPAAVPVADEPALADAAQEPESVWARLGLPGPNPNAPYAQPPKLELLFEDDFSTDTRGDYEIGGKEGSVTWEPGKLTLGPGATLSRKLDAEDWVELELDIEFPELTEDGQRSELRILLDLEPATDSYLQLRQRRRDGATTSELTLIDMPEVDTRGMTSSPPQKVRTLQLDGPLPSGRWRVGYRGGVWRVEQPDASKVWLACTENGHVTIEGLRITVTHQPLAINTFKLSQAAVAKAKWDDEQARELQNAERLNDQVIRLWRQGKSSAAIPIARTVLEIRQRLLGGYHSATAMSAYNLANQLMSVGNHAEAEPLFVHALVLRKYLLGERHPEYARSLNNLAVLYCEKGDFAKAEPLMVQALALRKELLGEQHPDYAGSLNNLAAIYQAMGDFERAEPLFMQSLSLVRELLGEQHQEYARSLANLAGVYFSMGKFARAEPLILQSLALAKELLSERHPDYVRNLSSLAQLYKAMGDYSRAEPLMLQATELTRDLLGERHPEYAKSLNGLAGLYSAIGDYRRAEPLFVKALTLRKTLLGEAHPEVADSLNDLATLYIDMSDYACAEPLLVQALELRKTILGEQHPDYASSLNNLATLYIDMGDYPRAERLLVKALELRRTLLGEKHPECAGSLSNLALLYSCMGDYPRAEPLFVQALELQKILLGEQHPNYVLSLRSLAGLYFQMGDYSRAEPLFLQIHALTRELQGERHPIYVSSLNDLAMLYYRMGDYSQAGLMLKQVLPLAKELLGEQHSDYVRGLKALAGLYYQMGEFSRAEPLFLQAHALTRELQGERHPHYANSLNNLASLYCATGDYSRAEPLQGEAVDITLNNLEMAAGIQSEPQQLAMSRTMEFLFANYVTCLADSDEKADSLMNRALKWKGSITARQRLMRLARETGDSKTRNLLQNLDSLSCRLATIALANPDGELQREAWRRQLRELGEERDSVERQLSEASAEYRTARAETGIDAQQLQSVFPADSALLDIHEYWCKTGSSDKRGQTRRARAYCGLVLRHGRPVALVELGFKAEVDRLIDQWRSGFGAVAADGTDPGAELRRLLWEPLAAKLEGIETVLISAEGATATLPWGALPGSRSGTYLLEEISIVAVPVPRMLPALLASTETQSELGGNKPAIDLLLVGGIDFDRLETAHGDQMASAGPALGPGQQARQDSPDLQGEANHQSSPVATGEVALEQRSAPSGRLRSAVRGDRATVYQPLPGTAREIETIGTFWRQWRETHAIDGPAGGGTGMQILSGPGATKERFARLARQSRHLHLATHGFFAPETLKSAMAATGDDSQRLMVESLGQQRVVGIHPGLLSGIVFAGANQPIDPLVGDQSILTAIEVAEMNLTGVDLAVLSACETGLGQVAGGEGVLGLQRAFQVAGARTTVTSLWKVDDAATQVLMARFYQNLWEKKRGRIESLREAQLWMLRHPEEVAAAIGQLRGGGEDEPAGAAESTWSSPRYWAAWVLSGDWR